ncbi:MAG: insulinase family protein, partial [Candidatus Eremiobacteraeota bacterium]|nr:insulinase family protein [Candidatus Eremiobacteraeota bacterium]
MKVRFLAFVMVLAAALYTPASTVAQTADQGVGDRGIYQMTLPNGLHVLTVENHSAPVVETAVWYHFGSLDERPGKTGLAHALEHMMFRGTQTMSAGGLTDAVARLGAQMNAQTDYDYTQFYFIMPSDKLSVAMRIESDRMHALALKQSEWDVERLAVLNELDGDESSPFYNLLSRVRAAAYPNSPSGRTPAGLRDDVAKATAADIASYYKAWYAPNNATLVIAGDVDHRTVAALATKLFGAIPKKSIPQHHIAHPAAATGKIVEADFPFPFEILDLAYAIPGDSEPGEPAVSALSKLISNERSPFYQALVETNVALSVEANADTQLHGGLMNVFIVLNPGHSAAEAQTIFQSTMDAALKNGFDSELVLASKRQTLAERTYSADSIGGYGDLVGYTYGIVGEKVADEDRRLSDLTPQTLLEAARKYLATPNVVGHLRPNDHPNRQSSQKSDATVSDDFTGRVPNGPIVQPAAIRAELQTPTRERSKLSPTQFTLSNGMRVIVQEKHDRPTVYVRGDIATSPAFVPSGEEGIADLASTLANFGSQKYDFTELRKRTDEIGAVVSLGQRFEAHGFARDFETLLDILADGESHPSFTERWLDLQRAQLANSIETQNQISGVMIQRSYLERL